MYRSVETDFPRGVTFFILSFKSILYEKSGVYWEPSDMLNLELTSDEGRTLSSAVCYRIKEMNNFIFRNILKYSP